MDSLREYAISLVTAALICGMISGMAANHAAKEIIRFLCGVLLTITVLRPLAGIDLENLLEHSFPVVQDVSSMTAEGKSMAEETMADIIKAETEAYILDKAAEWDAQLHISVSLNEDHLPVAVEIGGEVSPYIRRQLESMLQTDLGITKENQLWTGKP